VRKFAEAKERENEPRLKAAAAAGIVPQASGPVDVCKMVGIVAALGVGIGAVGTLTDVKTLPRGATRSLDDPFEDREARRRRRLF
jgi:hypothetical protein